MDFLLLRLEAPLQAWGLRGMWDIRDTGAEPSKSGVVGLLAASLGYQRGDPRVLELAREISIGVRVEREGLCLEDYHTVTDEHLLQADGKLFDGTIITRREYLHDASFLVVVAGPAGVIERCKSALLSPAWVPYLGRKCCVPSRPLLETCDKSFDSIEEALRKYPWDSHGEPPLKLRCIVEDPSGDEERRDRIGFRRPYLPRHVRVFEVDTPVGAR